MSATQSGRFFFIDEKHRLCFESKNMNGTFGLLYGGEVLACACNDSASLMALVCPVYAASSESCATTDAGKTLLRVYNVVDDELADLMDEIETTKATEVVWVDNRYIAVSCPQGISTILEYHNKKLKVLEEDYGLFPFPAVHRLALVNKSAQNITFWDLQRNKAVDTYTLPNRRAKKGKQRKASSTCGTGNFTFIANDDATIHGVYVTKGSVRELTPMISFFSSSRHRAQCDDDVPAAQYTVVASSLSSAQVVVGMKGFADICKFKYLKKDATLKLTGKATLPENCELVGLAKERCLVRLSDKAAGGKAGLEYKVVDLVFEQHNVDKAHASPTVSDKAHKATDTAVPAATQADSSLPTPCARGAAPTAARDAKKTGVQALLVVGGITLSVAAVVVFRVFRR